jgi:hypothetical protein
MSNPKNQIFTGMRRENGNRSKRMKAGPKKHEELRYDLNKAYKR